MEYRKAKEKDLDLFIENRMEFINTMRSMDGKERFREQTRNYIKEHIYKDDLLIYLAMENNEIAASCMACLYTTVPLPSCPSGKCAELLNVYTKKDYRRQGHAEKLISLLMEEAKELGIEKIWLDYTAEGYTLYKKIGFVELEHRMEIKIRNIMREKKKLEK